MKGDFTRSTFKPGKHYSGVRMQQGRVQLDADWNEQIDIATHRTETEAIDVIGGCGAPLHDAGFSLTPGPIPIPEIGHGRCYVDGILCENDAEVALDKQPDLPVAALGDLITPKNAPVDGGLYLAYLDVWQRHITALEDDGIREVALGGPDTATRTKTVWQVKLLGPFEALDCLSEPTAWTDLLDKTQNGKLSARAAPSTSEEGPCVVPPGAGYRRLENQLYRAEIHAVDGAGQITRLKWSRDNGAIVTRWLGQEASKPEELIVSSIGRDGVLSFGPGQYVEVVDDQRELRGEAGILVKLANAEGQVLTLDTTDPNAATVHIADFPPKIAGRPNNPKARRWDGVLANPATGVWLELEDGVQIKLETGKKYHVGDYWLIPARTATADVEWPRDPVTPFDPIPQPRAGIEHHYCKLAVLTRAAGNFTVTHDCRALFPPLTELTTVLYESGDGQEARPQEPLPQSLAVRVVNGQAPVIGARVQFTVEAGGGSLSVAQPVSTIAPNGIATCGWTLGDVGSGAQRVRAELLDAADNPVRGQILHFNASLSLADLLYVGGDGQEAMPGAAAQRLLPQPLRVRVINDQAPVIGARVQFAVTQGGGSLSVAAPVLTTAPDGIAECRWTLGTAGVQEVSAVLLDANNTAIPGQTVRFSANLSVASQVFYDPGKCSGLTGVATVQEAIDRLCKLVGQPREPGIHIERVEIGGLELHNDGIYPTAALADGIRVFCDSDIAANSIRGRGISPSPVCFVTLDLPYPLTPQDVEFWNSFKATGLLGHTPLIVAGTASAKGPVVTWLPLGNAVSWLRVSLPTALKQRFAGLPVLAHLTLKGNYIWGPDEPKLYLDGEVFGAPGVGSVEIRLPSGNSLRGGDFEAWFWLADIRIGTIPRRNITAATAIPIFLQALSLALNRDQLKPLVPVGYQPDPAQPFDPAKSRQMIKELGLQDKALQVWASETSKPLASAVSKMLNSNAGLKPQLNLIPGDQGELLTQIQTAVAAGQTPDLIIGDGSIADTLARQAPDLFDGSMVRI